MAKVLVTIEFDSLKDVHDYLSDKILVQGGSARPAVVEVRNEPSPTSAAGAAPQQTSAATAATTQVATATAAFPTEQDVKTAASAYLAKGAGRTPQTAREIFAKHGGTSNGQTAPKFIPEANRAACIAELSAA